LFSKFPEKRNTGIIKLKISDFLKKSLKKKEKEQEEW
jgi:hypothetical protein